MNSKKIISILAVSVLLTVFCIGASAADDMPKMTTTANLSSASSTDYLDFQQISSLEEMREGFEEPEVSEEFFEKTAKNITITKTSEGNFLLNGELGYCETSEIQYSDGSYPSGYFSAYKIILPEKYSDIKKDAIYITTADSKGEIITVKGEDISPDAAGSENAAVYTIINYGSNSNTMDAASSREFNYYKGGVSALSDAADSTTNIVKLSPNLVTSVRASTLDEFTRYSATTERIIPQTSLLKVCVDKDLKVDYDGFKGYGFPKESKNIEKIVQGYLIDGATLSLENFSTGDKEKDAQRQKELTNALWLNGLQIKNGKVTVSDTLSLYAAIYTMKTNGDIITTADITYNGTKIPAGSTIKSKGESTVTVITPDKKESTMNVALTTSSPGFGILAVLAGLGTAAVIPAIRRRKGN